MFVLLELDLPKLCQKRKLSKLSLANLSRTNINFTKSVYNKNVLSKWSPSKVVKNQKLRNIKIPWFEIIRKYYFFVIFHISLWGKSCLANYPSSLKITFWGLVVIKHVLFSPNLSHCWKKLIKNLMIIFPSNWGNDLC